MKLKNKMKKDREYVVELRFDKKLSEKAWKNTIYKDADNPEWKKHLLHVKEGYKKKR